MKPTPIDEQLIADIEFRRRAEALVSRLQRQHEAERLEHPPDDEPSQEESEDDDSFA